MNSSDYVTPFAQRTFGERFSAVWNVFTKNFGSFLKFVTPVFLAIVAVFVLAVCSMAGNVAVKDYNSAINNVYVFCLTIVLLCCGPLAAMLSLFSLYVKNKTMKGLAFGQVYGGALAMLGKIFVFGFVFGLVYYLVAWALGVVVEHIVGFSWWIVGVGYILNILWNLFASIACMHFCLSNKWGNILDVVGDTFAMLNGKIWNTIFWNFLWSLIGVLSFTVICWFLYLLVIIAVETKSYIAIIIICSICALIFLLLCLICQILLLLASMFQYSYLFTCKEIKKNGGLAAEPEQSYAAPEVARQQPDVDTARSTVVRHGDSSSTGGCKIVLTSAGGNKLQAVKALTDNLGMSLSDAKKCVDSVPCELSSGLSMYDAMNLKIAIEKSGASVDVIR